jgi:hypothetical protein
VADILAHPFRRFRGLITLIQTGSHGNSSASSATVAVSE